jgi:hypothetical protein
MRPYLPRHRRVGGWGKARAAALVRRYGSLDGVLKAGLFRSQAEMLRLYRLIATMDASAPLPSLADRSPTWVSASNLARSWGLNSWPIVWMAWHDVVVEERRGPRPPVSAWRRHRDAGEDVAVGGKRASTADPRNARRQLSCLILPSKPSQ